jgi:ribonuclease T2
MIFALLLAPLTSCAEPAHFDYYLLALSVAPAFCEDAPQRKQKFAQCRDLSGAGFRAMPLTLTLLPAPTDLFAKLALV